MQAQPALGDRGIATGKAEWVARPVCFTGANPNSPQIFPFKMLIATIQFYNPGFRLLAPKI